jgi:SAM-dependent methyltransferase
LSPEEYEIPFGEKRAKEIFIPNSPNTVNRLEIFQYIQNVEVEIAQDLFNRNELILIADALYGNYLDRKKRAFFLYHFLPLWETALRILFNDNLAPKIIELGCGTGASSLLFAILGARVVGIDLDGDLIRVCNKRKAFYENYLDSVYVDFFQANAFEFPFKKYAPVDAFFSLFAFNLMQPSDILLRRILPALKESGKVVIVDGNSSSLYSHIIPSRRRRGTLSPTMIQKKLEILGCRVSKLQTHCAIPPFFFAHQRFQRLAQNMEYFFRLSGLHRFLGISYTLVAEKTRESQ